MSPLADTSHFRLPSHHSSQMFDNVFSSNAANMAMDAVSFMHPYRHFQWICRSLLMLNRSILRQLPKEYRVSVDADQFLSSMTMELDADLVLHWYSKFDASGLVRIRSKESQEMLSSLVLEKRKKKIRPNSSNGPCTTHPSHKVPKITQKLLQRKLVANDWPWREDG